MDFYSTRHGTALADAGVLEKDIAASMHHTTTQTTRRYLHSGRRSLTTAIEALPDLAYPQAATGTDGTTDTERLRNSNDTGGLWRINRPFRARATNG